MRKLVLLFVLGSFMFGLAACSSLGTIGANFALKSDEEVLAFQALSSVQMLDVNQNQTVSSLGRTSKMSNEEMTSIDQIEPYLELFEQLLTQQNGLSVSIVESDLVEYETKQIFQVSDILGDTVTYTMYYNTTSLLDDTLDDSSDDDDMEEEYQINGILIYGDVTYTIEGKREVEEDEEKLEMISRLSETDYVKVTYKVEEDETKFSYRTYQLGELVNESSIKVEVEDQELKIRLSYQEGDNEGEYTFKFEEEDGKTIIKISFETLIDGVEAEGEAKVLVSTDELTGETYYTIITKGMDDDEEHEERHDRDMDTDEDEDDDHDENEDENEDESEDD